MISDAVKSDIVSSYDIADYIGADIKLTRKGSRMWGCCPFHKEKTPSFSVNTALGRWFCFGCHKGGDIISYVRERDGVSFSDAIRILAHGKGIEVEDNVKPTPEQVRKDKAVETLRLANSVAQDFFRQQYLNSTKAQEYASGRWGTEFCEEVGIGCAPQGWSGLTDYVKSQGYDLRPFLELGLIRHNEAKNRYYDFFRNRITIPIRDIAGGIIGFTARDVSGQPDAPKYLNSQESPVYCKSRSVFGINVARRGAASLGKLVMVEGAPDVLRLQSIGITNAVASLGSKWTDEQLETLKRLAKTVTFIPDDDVIKQGQRHGTGVVSVMETGRRAIAMGFHVFVKELPNHIEGQKQDCDSAITTAQFFYDIPEQDFIVWYAAKQRNEGTATANNELIAEVSSLVASTSPNEIQTDLYVEELSKIIGTKALWRKALSAASTTATNESRLKMELERANKIDRSTLCKFGFYELDGSYWTMNDKGAERRWSNFTLAPLFLIRDTTNPKRLYRMKNVHGQEEIIELKIEDMVSLPKFRMRIEGLGNFIWQGTDSDLTKLKSYLYENTETAEEITQLGWQKGGFFAFGNGIYNGGLWHPADNFGIVRLTDGRNFYLPATSQIYRTEPKLFQYERSFVHLGKGESSLQEVARQIETVFGDNGIIGICFLLATLFRDIITDTTKAFPILNMFGPKGAGKSELGHTLMSFFVIKNTPPNISNATLPALSDAISKCSDALVHLDEFKNDLDLSKREFLKGLWDGTGRSRMNMDKDKKMEMTSVDSGVMISGQEMATADIALFSRFIFLRFSRTSYDEQEKKAFSSLQSLQGKGFSHITLQILNERPHVESEYPTENARAINDLAKATQGVTLEDRILKNWSVLLAAFRILSKYINLPWEESRILEILASNMTQQQDCCKQNNELGNFWEAVSVLKQEGQVAKRCDYDIRLSSSLKTDKCDIEWVTPRKVLYLRPSKIFTLYQKQAKQLGDTALPRASLKYYLENSPEFLGTKNAVRFVQIINNVIQYEMVGNINREKQQVERALCFDYEALKNNTGVDLEDYILESPTSQQDDKTPF